ARIKIPKPPELVRQPNGFACPRFGLTEGSPPLKQPGTDFAIPSSRPLRGTCFTGCARGTQQLRDDARLSRFLGFPVHSTFPVPSSPRPPAAPKSVAADGGRRSWGNSRAG